MNRVTLIGKLSSDIKFKDYAENKKMSRFTLLTVTSYTNKNGVVVDKTEWHKIVVFSYNISKYLEQYAKNGDYLVIEGALRYNKINKEDSDAYDIYAEVVVDDSRNGGSVSILQCKASPEEKSIKDKVKELFF